MNLFLESPQQAAERLLREQRLQERLLRHDGPNAALDLDEPTGFEHPRKIVNTSGGVRDNRRLFSRVGKRGPAAYAPNGSCENAFRASSACAGTDYAPNDASYSLEQQTYREELAFEKRRRHRQRIAGVARVIVSAIFVPVGLAIAFLAAYVLTCILSGATLAEVVELLKNLLEGGAGLVQDALLSR